MFVYIVLGPVVLGIVLNAPGLYNKSSSAGPVAPQKRGLSPGEKKTTEEESPRTHYNYYKKLHSTAR